jgi:hypothetical protein
MNRIIILCMVVAFMTSCAHVRPLSESTGIAQYSRLLRTLGEPLDIRPELGREFDTYTRLLYLPSFSAPICVTVRGGLHVPGNAVVRTQIVQTGRGTPLSASWEPNYSRVIFSSDSMVDQDSYMELLMRLIDVKFDTENQRPEEFGGLDGATCVLEHAEGTNDYFFIEVWSPTCMISDDMRKNAKVAFPDRQFDFDAINDFLRRTVNVLSWFAQHTSITQFDEYTFKKDNFQQTDGEPTSEPAPNADSEASHP